MSGEWTEFANQLLGLTTQDGIQMDSVLEAYITKEGKDPRPDYLGINVIALGWPRSLRLRKAVVRCSLKWCTKLRIKSSLNGVAEQVLSVLTMLEQLQRITNTAWTLPACPLNFNTGINSPQTATPLPKRAL